MSLATIEEAVAAVMAVAPAPTAESAPAERAMGRTLAADLQARADHPGADVSAMDGYACRAADTAGATSRRPKRLKVVGEAAAGALATGTLRSGEAVTISTGAPLPQGSDAIAVLEDTRRDGEDVVLSRPATPKHIRRKGEDLLRGQAYLLAGEELDPFRLAAVAALGHAELEVVRRPRVAVLVTGPELVPPNAPTRSNPLFDSNGPLLLALLRRFGAEPSVRSGVGDREEEMEAAWTAASDADLIVTTGGASIGRHDAVRRVLEAEGRLVFGGVSVRPGGPAMLAAWRDKMVLALPGNPVAAALLATVLLSAWCHAALGRRGRPPFLRDYGAVATTPVGGIREKTCLWLANAATDEQGRVAASVVRPQGPARIEALLRANAVIVMPPGQGVAAGAAVRLVALPVTGSRGL
ncbi:MAG: molybdopterin molybdotransferase MoeA [Trueperaceae bacterium]